jgi:hypothetical protein
VSGPTQEPKGAALEEPTLLELFLRTHLTGCNLTPCNCGCDKTRAEFDRLQSENERLTKERDALEAEKAKLFDVIERNSVGNLRALYGGKVKVTRLETGSQPEKMPPTG